MNDAVGCFNVFYAPNPDGQDKRTMLPPLTPVALSDRQAVLDAGGFSLTEARYAANRKLALHVHRNTAFIFILDGSVREQCRGLGTCSPLGLVTIPAGEPHAEMFPAPGARCLIIEVADNRAAVIRSFSPILDEPSYTRGAQVAGLGLRMYGEFRDPDDVAPLAIEGLVLELSALALRSRTNAASPGEPPWLRRVRDAIHASFHQPLRIEDMAAEAGVHPVYLARAFRKHHGRSPSEYLRRLRVEAAGEMLVHSGMPLARVALAAGFSDQSHLTRQFKRIVGVSPGRYRAEARRAANLRI